MFPRLPSNPTPNRTMSVCGNWFTSGRISRSGRSWSTSHRPFSTWCGRTCPRCVNIGVGTECAALAGLYHVVRKEEPQGNKSGHQSADMLGARVLYLDKDYRIHGSNPAAAARALPEGCIRLINEDVIYLYDRTPLE